MLEPTDFPLLQFDPRQGATADAVVAAALVMSDACPSELFDIVCQPD
jgi:hypothetical protein